MNKIEDKKIETRKNQIQKFTGKRVEIQKRRGKIYLLDLQGYSNQEIADKLDVSLSTVEKDIHESRLFSVDLYYRMGISGMFSSYVDCIQELELVKKELWRKYRNGRVEEKQKALTQIGNFALRMCNSFGIQPTKLTPSMMDYMDDKLQVYDAQLNEEVGYIEMDWEKEIMEKKGDKLEKSKPENS